MTEGFAGSRASASTWCSGRPVLMGLHVTPPSTLFWTPHPRQEQPSSAAYIVVGVFGSNSTEVTSARQVHRHVDPPSAVRQNPLSSASTKATSGSTGLTAIVAMCSSDPGNPVRYQVRPASSERYTHGDA